MPKMFVVTGQVDLEAVAGSVLNARLSAETRTQALDAIRRANPGLDIDRLHPGEVLVIPPVPGTRPPARCGLLGCCRRPRARRAGGGARRGRPGRLRARPGSAWVGG